MSRPQFTFPDIAPRYDSSSASFPVVAKVRKETGPYVKNRRDEAVGDRQPDNGIAIIIRTGLLALIKPYTRRANRMVWNTTRGRGIRRRKEREREGEGRDWHRVEEQDRVRERNEREALGAVC